jgi:predicted GNAT superfamily acetyltransferase
MLLAAVHGGGLVVGVYLDSALVGFVFGFPGLYFTPDGPRAKHCSHMLAVHPDYRGQGLGFRLKRAQWQMVRHQGVDLITWTYDPLLSRNAYLNIAKLGAVCHTYLRNFYGDMRDELNVGLPSDRFQVDWWVGSWRVNRRLSKRARRLLSLDQFLSANVQIINTASPSIDPTTKMKVKPRRGIKPVSVEEAILMVEIPADILAIKSVNPALALEWRLHIRSIFEDLFSQGYLVTDFVYRPGQPDRSFYVLSNGESTL